MQKDKQKGTMQEMNSLAQSMMMFITDTGYAPSNPDGDLSPSQPIFSELSALHIKIISMKDQWGAPKGLDTLVVRGTARYRCSECR